MRLIDGRKLHVGAALLACALAATGCDGKTNDTHRGGGEDSGASAPSGDHDAGRERPEDAGSPADSGSDDDGGDASVPAQACTGGTVLPVTGDYVDGSGTEHWLRKTASATTYTRVPGGAPGPAKPPTPWRAVGTCPDQKTFAAPPQNATHARALWTTDALQDGSRLHLCVAAEEMADVAAAFAAPKSNANALGAGCKGGPWMTLTTAKDGGR